MKNLTSMKWWKAAGVRAIKTMAQVIVATIGTSTLISEVNWIAVGSTAVMAGVLSILTSIAGIPEVDGNNITIDTLEELTDGRGEDDEQ